MWHILFWMASSLALLAITATARAEDVGIVAVVNDEVISSLDLAARSQLVLATTGRAADSPEMRSKLRRQVLQMLIDEALKLQEAKRFNIVVEQRDIDDAIARIEQSQGKPAGSLKAFIAERGLSQASFERQIESEVAWSKLIARKVRRNIAVSDDEIYRAQQRMAQGKKVSEVQVASIVLPVAEPAKADETLGLARDIRSQLLNGAEGPELVQRYADRIPLEFGPMVWVPRAGLNPQIAAAIENLKPGDIAEPIALGGSIQLIRLLDERTSSSKPEQNAEVAVKQIVLKLDEKSLKQQIDAFMGIAREIAKYPGTCQEKGIAGMQDFEGLNIEVNYVRTTLAAMSKDVRLLVEPLKLTAITEPFAAPDGIHLLMLCEKIALPVELPQREEVREAVYRERLDLEVEKYLRTMRREAFIDVRV